MRLLLLLLLLEIGISDDFLHVLTGLRHLQYLLFLLIDVLVEVVGHLGVEYLLLIG